MIRRIDLTGDYRTTIYAAARRLLADGANPLDVIETWRKANLSMSGTIGECSKWEVVDDAGLRLRKHRPKSSTSQPLAAVPGLPGNTLAKTSKRTPRTAAPIVLEFEPTVEQIAFAQSRRRANA